jgi:hypothetical protein
MFLGTTASLLQLVFAGLSEDDAVVVASGGPSDHQPGDLHHALGLKRAWLCVEANGPGFELAVKIGADAYAVRVSDDPLVRARLALAACQMPELGVR